MFALLEKFQTTHHKFTIIRTYLFPWMIAFKMLGSGFDDFPFWFLQYAKFPGEKGVEVFAKILLILQLQSQKIRIKLSSNFFDSFFILMI